MLFSPERGVKKFANRVDRSIRCRLVEFEAMAEKLNRRLKAWGVEGMIGARIDNKLYRGALALAPGYPTIIPAVHHVAALTRWGPVIEFADQDQRGNSQVAFESKARRIESDRRTEFVLRGLFDRAAFDRCERQPAALRKAQHRNAGRINEGLPHQKVQNSVCIKGQINWSAAVAGVLDAARTETVDGERHIAPGCDPLSPALVEPLPIPIASMQQHDSGRGAWNICLPQIALQRLRTGKRALEFDHGRGRFRPCRVARDRISDQECSDECRDLGKLRQGPPFRVMPDPPIAGGCLDPQHPPPVAFQYLRPDLVPELIICQLPHPPL